MKPFTVQNPKLMFLGFHLCWGIFLWGSISKYGLGTSRDSAEYLFTSLNLSSGNGFTSFSGQPYVLWPPLYPFLLSLLQRLGVNDPLDAAIVLQLITFAWISFLIIWLFSKIFSRNLAFAFIGNALAGTGVALTMLFAGVGSDYLHIALALSMVYLSNEYMKNNRLKTVWLMTLVSALAMLQRYIGVSIMLTGMCVVYFYSRTTILERVKRVVLISLSVIPVGVWILSLPASALERGGPSSLPENIYWFTVSALTWLFPYSALLEHPFRMQIGLWTFWLLIIICIAFVLTIRRRSLAEAPILLFGLIYTITLLAISSLSYFNRLDERFVSQVFIPFVVLLLAASETVLETELLKNAKIKVVGSIVVFSSLLMVLGLFTYQSVVLTQTLKKDGSGYTSREWYDNHAIEYWLRYLPEKEHLAFSNYPAGLAIHSWRETLPSPRRNPNPGVDEIVYPLNDYLPSLFEVGKDSYLIWIEPNSYEHVYSVDELRLIVNIETLYENEDGGIYKLLPPGNR